ncbi:MAG TPA: hypothetical protein DCZ72_04330 [Armatimonadetes bacterium]|nr:hypothetical protein [Armatimonadota bacterium]
MDHEYIDQLAHLLAGTRVAEITVRRGDRSVTVRRNLVAPAGSAGPPPAAATWAETSETPTMVPLLAPAAAAAAPAGTEAHLPLPSPNGSAALVATGEPEEPETVIVEARRVGFFHRHAAEGAEPAMAVGDWVAPGQVLGSVESMKVFDEFVAPSGGVVIGVFVAEGEAVEYGQPLVHLELCEAPGEQPAAAEGTDA